MLNKQHATVPVAQTLSNEQRLWMNVVRQAIEDARRSLEQKQLQIRMDVQRARDWLLKPNKDFEIVCALADLEASKVRAFARKAIEDAQADHARQVIAGVGENFLKGAGTGGGRHARVCKKMEFLQEYGRTAAIINEEGPNGQ